MRKRKRINLSLILSMFFLDVFIFWVLMVSITPRNLLLVLATIGTEIVIGLFFIKESERNGSVSVIEKAREYLIERVKFETNVKELLEKRYCFSCGRPISFREFLNRNKDCSYEDLKKLWLSRYIQLYCCICYREKPKFMDVLKEPRKERFKCVNQMCNDVQFYLMASEMLEDLRQRRKKKLVKHIKYFIVTVLVMVGSFIPSLIVFMNIYWF